MRLVPLLGVMSELRRVRAFVLSATLSSTLLAGCGLTSQGAQSPRIAPCDTLSGSGTAAGRGVALAYAQRQVSHQFADARGDLLRAGYRRIRVIGRSSECRADKIGGLSASLITCTAKVRVCGK
jgi:hypothetical protein